MYGVKSPCDSCNGRCRNTKGPPLWHVKTALKRGEGNYTYMSWDCPNDISYYPYMMAMEIWQKKQAGFHTPELSADGVDAYLYIDETVKLHRRALEWQQTH